MVLLAGHVAKMGKIKKEYEIVVGKPKGKDLFKDEGIGGKVILSRDRETLDEVWTSDWLYWITHD